MRKKIMLAVLIAFAMSVSGRTELVSEWKFDGDLKDSTGENHGKFVGKTENPTWAPDRWNNPGKAIVLADDGDYIDCGNDGSLSFGDSTHDHAFTIEAWVKMNDRESFQIANRKGEYLLTNNNNIRLYLYDGNQNCNTLKNAIYKSAGDLMGKEWTHIVVTYNGCGDVKGIKFYVDGLQRGWCWERFGGPTNYTAMKTKECTSFCIGGEKNHTNVIDEIRIYNHALTADEVAARYNTPSLCEEETKKDMQAKYEQALLNLSEQERQLPVIFPLTKIYLQAIDAELNELLREVKNADETGKTFLSYAEFKSNNIYEKRKRVINLVDELTKISKSIERGKVDKRDVCVCQIVDPMSQNIRRILPFWGSPIHGDISMEIMLEACCGEYEPASFVVTALADLNSLSVTVSDLQKTDADKEVISASAVNIKLVKCWYQSGNAGIDVAQNKARRVLIPELLLNDDSLLKVDFEKKDNYLRLSFPEGDKYIWISDPAWDDALAKKWGDVREITTEKFPIKDASVLQPVNVAAGRNQQFWLTVKVPDSASAGLYEGKISLVTAGKEVSALSLRLRVLPFALSAPYYTFSIDYHGNLLRNFGTISSGVKTRQQFKRELANMVSHNLSNCQHYNITTNMLGEVLKIRREVGMDNETLYLKHPWLTSGDGMPGVGNPTEPEALEQIKKNVRDILEFVRPYGTKTVYFYGIDEVTGDLLKSQRPAWEAVREAGGKIFVAGGGDNVKMMADIQDLHVRAGALSAKEAAEWHSYGHKIFSYANPQCGVENPEVYRRNFGLLLWKNDYDGAADNAYQHTMGFTWNDFDHPIFSDHNQTYPAMDGPIDTVQWEGYREAADDVRYVTTLQNMITEANKYKPTPKRGALLAAEEYLKNLKKGNDIETMDLNLIRREIIRIILNLQREMHVAKKRPTPEGRHPIQ